MPRVSELGRLAFRGDIGLQAPISAHSLGRALCCVLHACPSCMLGTIPCLVLSHACRGGQGENGPQTKPYGVIEAANIGGGCRVGAWVGGDGCGAGCRGSGRSGWRRCAGALDAERGLGVALESCVLKRWIDTISI